MKNKINYLLETSKKVLLNNSLENGAIVAANTDNNYYPKNVVNYRFVWPRDAAYSIYAANLLGLDNIQKSFIEWLLTRAEGFQESGILFQRYATNGARDIMMGHQYQPDQAGALLWSLTESNSRADKDLKKTVRLLANGLCKNWNGNYFNVQTHDLWETRNTFPRYEDNLIYTLAACSFGLRRAYKLLGEKKWLKVSKEMEKSLKNTKLDYYPRLSGLLPDENIDASVLGLVWPFKISTTNSKLLNSIKKIEDELMTPQGLHRYKKDKYDGTIYNMVFGDKGAGGWPLLTFWYVIALSKIGEKEKANKLFKNYLKNFEDYIPEQLFDNKIQTPVSPLNWSHAMFVIACKELGFLS